MFAMRVPRGGGPEDFRQEEVDTPQPGIGDVLVRVHAASFTPDELSWPCTWRDRLGRDRAPVVPGHEVAGEVVALGSGTFGLEVGQEVHGLVDWYRDGSLAEYVAVDVRDLAPKPGGLSWEEAAAVPLPGLTAWQALHDLAHVQPGQTVLVHGAAGGVGTYAVQLARAAGTRVIATGRATHREGVEALGPDRFVDLDAEEPAAAGPVDVVVDLVGGKLLDATLPLVRPGGTVVVLGAGATVPPPEGVRLVDFVVRGDTAELTEIDRLLTEGAVRPIIGARFSLSQAAEAFAAKLGGGIPGKVILSVR